MSSVQLTTQEQTSISLLPVQLQPFVKARFGRQIKSFEPKNLYREVLDMVQITLAESGVKDQSDIKVVKFISETIWKDLQGPKFNHLSIDDIKLALHLGVRREYGEYMGVNVQAVHFWIKSFIGDKNRELAIKEFNDKVVKTSEKPVIYTEDFYKRAAIDAFESYKKSGNLPSAGPSAGIYDCIVRALNLKTLINQDEWKEVLDIGKQNYTERMTPKKFYPSGKVKSVGNVVLDYSLENATLKFEIKKEALRRYFDKLINNGKTLEL